MNRKSYSILWLTASLIFFSSCELFESDPNDKPGDEFVTYEEILFIRGSSSKTELCAIRPDGSDFRVISGFENIEYSPSNDIAYRGAKWSPDKRYVALVGGPESDDYFASLWLLTSGGEYIRKLTENAANVFWYDNETIYFTRAKDHSLMQYDLYRMKIDDLEEVLVFAQTDSTNIDFEDFVNESEWIAVDYSFGSDNEGKFTLQYGDLLSVNLDTSTRTYLLPDSTKIERHPRLAPGKNIVAYTSQLLDYASWPPRNLFWFNLEEETPHQLTFFTGFNPYQNASYAWDPTGDQIAVSNPYPMLEGWQPHYPPFSDIFIIDLQTGQEDTLTHTAQDSVRNLVVDWR